VAVLAARRVVVLAVLAAVLPGADRLQAG